MIQRHPQDDRKAELNRQRVARSLLRDRFGIAPARVEYDGRVLDGLIRAGLLAEAQVRDQEAINRALCLFLADAFLADDLRRFLTALG
jgi:hypothetical protein